MVSRQGLPVERVSGSGATRGYTHAPPVGGSQPLGSELEREYSLDLPRVVEAVAGFNVTRVGLQFPAGLRDRATEAAAAFVAAGFVPIISADPCYGACDLADREMLDLGVEMLVHFGHFEHPHLAKHYKMPVYFVPVRSPVPLAPAVEAAAPLLRVFGKRVGVTTTAQHAEKLPAAMERLREMGFEPKLARGDTRLYMAGQIVGCNVSCATALTAQVDAFLYLGTGLFHPVAIGLTTETPLICADPFTREAFDIAPHRERFLRQRWAAVARARDAKRWGILISTKTGQTRTAEALAVARRLRAEGHEAHLIALRDITPENLLHFRHLDAFVAAACPRVPVDDAAKFERPLLTVQEMELALGGATAGAYVFDQIRPEAYDPVGTTGSP